MTKRERGVVVGMGVLALALLVGSAAVTRGQQNIPSTRGRPRDAVQEFIREDSIAKASDQGPPPPSAVSGVDSMVRLRYLESDRAYYEFRRDGYVFAMQAFRWQHFSTQVTFWVVILLVFAGLLLSWMQFRAGFLGNRAQVPGEEPSADDAPVAPRQPVPLAPPTNSTVEIGPGGLKVASPVLGVIVLALSLGFFYLYLVHVYPITEVK